MYNAPKGFARGLRRALLPVVALAMAATPLAGLAQSAPEGVSAPPAKAAPPATRRAEAPSRVIALEGDEIVGKVPKPQVFYLLGRSESHYRGLRVRRSFVPRIVETLERNPL